MHAVKLVFAQLAFREGVLGRLGKCRKSQIWIAVSVYVPVAIVKQRFNKLTARLRAFRSCTFPGLISMPGPWLLDGRGDRI